MTEKFIKSERGTIYYWISDCENKNAKTIVFLHGLTADHTLFEKQIACFEKEYRVLCWDAPAHGKSRPYCDFSYKNLAEELKNILETERITRAVFIGQSMGGFVIQAFLKRYPGYAEGFVGIDTTPFGLSYYSRSDKWWLRQIEWMSRCYPHKMLIKGIAKSCTYTGHAYENMLAALLPYSKRELCYLMGIGYSAFLEENCDLQIPCPVLILVGEYDKTGKVKQYCKKWQEKTGYPLHIIKNAAHNANMDNDAQTNGEIESFIKKLKNPIDPHAPS